jgi:hypothetical protein
VENPWGDEPVLTAPEPGAAPPAAAPEVANPWGDEPVAFATPQRPAGFMNRVKDAFTGNSRLDPDYADRPEFGDAFRAEAGEKDPESLDRIRNAIGLAQVAPTETGQLNILKSRIPGLEISKDKFGQTVLKAPGMAKPAYLNKPGFSAQDVGEAGMTTIATLPAAMATGGGALLARMGVGAANMAGASVGRDLMAAGAGSEEGVDPMRAGVSGAIGGGIPLVGAAAKAALQYPLSKIRGALAPDRQASRAVTSAVEADRRVPRGTPLTAPEATAAGRRGQDLRVIDTGGEATRALARSAANQSPEARALLMNLADDRLEGQTGRLETFIRDLVQRPGQAGGPNAFMTREALEVAARSARGPLYDKAYKDGAQGLMSPMLTQLARAPALQSAMRAAAGTMQNRAAAGTTTGMRGPNGHTLEFWDQVKRRLDDEISTLKRSGAKSAALDIDNLRRPLVTELDRLVGSYGAARGTAQTFFKANDALEAGENFVNGRFNEDASRRALAGMTAQERDLFAEGFASRFIEQARRVGDRRSLLNSINNSATARERFSIALGPNRARSMESFLRIEALMDLPRMAMGNSTTARQLMELGLTGYGLYSGDPHSLLLAGLSYGNRAIERRVAERVARLLLSPNPQQFMQGLKQVGSTPMLDNLRHLDKMIVRSGLLQGVQEAAPSTSVPTPRPPAPRPALPPIPPSTPAPAPAPIPSVGGAPRRADLQGADEARRMAAEAIERGASAEAVNARLASYLAANGFTDDTAA